MHLLSPFRGLGKLTKFKVNRTLHGRSVYRKTNVRGHNVFKGYSNPGVGDAIDLFCPAGTEVYAMHSGRITVRGKGTLSENVFLTGVQSSIEVVTVYAHIKTKDSLKSGSTVTAGQVIGWVNRLLKNPHLHLEIWIDDKVLTEGTPSKLRTRISNLVE